MPHRSPSTARDAGLTREAPLSPSAKPRRPLLYRQVQELLRLVAPSSPAPARALRKGVPANRRRRNPAAAASESPDRCPRPTIHSDGPATVTSPRHSPLRTQYRRTAPVRYCPAGPRECCRRAIGSSTLHPQRAESASSSTWSSTRQSGHCRSVDGGDELFCCSESALSYREAGTSRMRRCLHPVHCSGFDRFQAFASPPARRIVPDRGYPRQHFEFDPKDECQVRIFAYILIRFDFVSGDRPVNERPLYAIPP